MTDMNFLGNTTFPPPKEFTRKKEQFDELCYMLRANMNLLNPGYNKISKRLEENPCTVMQDEDLHEVQQAQ